MKSIVFYALLFCSVHLFSQEKIPADWGLTQIPFTFKGEDLNILLYNAREDYTIWKKPLFLFVQGSMPQPLLKYDKKGNLYDFFKWLKTN